MAIAALHAKKTSVADVTDLDLQEAICWLNTQVDPHKSHLGPLSKLKVLSSYWQNNPLAGHNMGVGGQNVPFYRQVLEDLMSGSPKTYAGCCQVCGKYEVYRDGNRSWLPLGAGAESDPCSYPNLRGKSLCVRCFSAVLLIPLGCKFVGSNPYFIHLTDPELLCKATEDGFRAVSLQMAAGQTGNIALKAGVKLIGRIALLEIVSGSRWDGTQNPAFLKNCPTGATIIAFSNSGPAAAWYQVHLPAQALAFFDDLDTAPQQSQGELRLVFLDWARHCEKPDFTDKEKNEKRNNSLFDRLCDDLEQRQSLSFLVRAIVQRRKPTQQILKKKEKQVLEIYERTALNKQDRFAMLERIADHINDMDERYRSSLVKRLANTRSKDSLYKLLIEFAHTEKTSLRLSREELQMIDTERSSEVIGLLYLLCIAER